MDNVVPRAPTIQYHAPHGTRWEKEKAAAGGSSAFDLPTDPKVLGPWVIGECVGKGASGRVKIARHRFTGQLAAVKILPLAPLVNSRSSLATRQQKSEKQRLGIDREITMMKLMNHPNILRLFDVYQGSNELFLILEYVQGGELFDFLVNKGRLSHEEALPFFKQIIYGLNYAHTFSIIHRDLKPENILIASLDPPLIKIADWGMAAFAPPSKDLETSCGSPHYASPEIVNGEKYQGNATDIWSCGVILYALLTGRLPFDDKDLQTLLKKVKSGKYNMPEKLDPMAQDLISKMLVIDTDKRITIPEILAHPWMSGPASPTTTDIAKNPPLPPSPSTLARPLAHPGLIDPELFDSLRIIWGRHADPNGEIIKRDLCSPAGQGVYTKAFYFLLNRYREETSHAAQADQRRSVMSKYGVGNVDFDMEWELDTTGFTPKPVSFAKHERKQHGGGVHFDNGVRPVQVSGLAPPLMIRNHSSSSSASSSSASSRDRPASPGGPRTPTQKHRSALPSPAPYQIIPDAPGPAPAARTSAAPTGSRPIPKRGRTYDNIKFDNGTSTTATFIQQPQRASSQRYSSRPKSSDISKMVLNAPRRHEVPASAPTSPTRFGTTMPYKADQNAMDHIVEKVNELALSGPNSANITRGRRASVAVHHHLHREQDKENQSFNEEGWSYVREEDLRTPGGRIMGRDMGNLGVNGDGKKRKEKDRKSKPPPLDFSPLSRKPSEYSVVNSPGGAEPMSPTPISTALSRKLSSSPAVGEFKGWFSNLFGWKNQHGAETGILYSPHDLAKTRNEIARQLQGLGVLVDASGIITGGDDSGCGGDEYVLRCQVQESNPIASIHLNAKNLRFRVEFMSAHQPGVGMATPTMATPPTNLLSTAPLPPRGRGSMLPLKSAPLSPLLSPNLSGSATVTFNNTRSGAAVAGGGEYSTAIILVHEKGSVSTFKNVWKKLKATFSMDGVLAQQQYPCMSPMIGSSTPVLESPHRFVV